MRAASWRHQSTSLQDVAAVSRDSLHATMHEHDVRILFSSVEMFAAKVCSLCWDPEFSTFRFVVDRGGMGRVGGPPGTSAVGGDTRQGPHGGTGEIDPR